MLQQIRACGLQDGDVFSEDAQDGSDWFTVDGPVRRVCPGTDAWVEADVTQGWTIELGYVETVWIEERGERWMR